MATMRGVIYSPPDAGLPFLAVIFHTDGSVMLARPFIAEDDAKQYIVDVSGELIVVNEDDDAANS